jgi:hypothetical protein
VWQDDAQHYSFRLPNGATLLVEDHFFGHHSPDNYLRADLVAETALSFKSPFDGESLQAIFGRNYFKINSLHPIELGVDVVASAFFMLSRWEELARPERDEHGRFPSSAALATRAGFLDRPVVHEWADLLWQSLVRLGWPPAERRPHAYQVTLSCDVDHPRLWWQPWQRARTLLGTLGRPDASKSFAWWWREGVFEAKDSYDTFDLLTPPLCGHSLKVAFNFLGQRPRHFDCWYDLQHPAVRDLMQKIAATGHTIGFHPSREAFDDAARFDLELASLRAVSPLPVETGRHHYLRFAAPYTWQRWADAGLKMDSTLGYSDAEGFRAGICVPYPVFNVLTRRTLPLLEQPLLAMDVTLVQYRRYSPEQAAQRLLYLAGQVRRWGGEMTLLWHNSSFNTYEWAPYRHLPALLAAQE